jgi:predicted HTH domain antitoxin
MSKIVYDSLLESELAAIVKAGKYRSEKEAIRHALEVLLVSNSQLRLDTAVELYREKKVTLSRAAEIAELSFGKFKEELAERSISITVDSSPEEILEGAPLIKKLRSES